MYTGTRGFDEQRIAEALDGLEARGWVADGRLTPSGRAARLAVEDATDRAHEPLVARLGDRVDDVTPTPSVTRRDVHRVSNTVRAERARRAGFRGNRL